MRSGAFAAASGVSAIGARSFDTTKLSSLYGVTIGRTHQSPASASPSTIENVVLATVSYPPSRLRFLRMPVPYGTTWMPV